MLPFCLTRLAKHLVETLVAALLAKHEASPTEQHRKSRERLNEKSLRINKALLYVLGSYRRTVTRNKYCERIVFTAEWQKEMSITAERQKEMCIR